MESEPEQAEIRTSRKRRRRAESALTTSQHRGDGKGNSDSDAAGFGRGFGENEPTWEEESVGEREISRELHVPVIERVDTDKQRFSRFRICAVTSNIPK